jgi:hypothetical protein
MKIATNKFDTPFWAQKEGASGFRSGRLGGELKIVFFEFVRGLAL